jgi:hypothetical protein
MAAKKYALLVTTGYARGNEVYDQHILGPFTEEECRAVKSVLGDDFDDYEVLSVLKHPLLSKAEAIRRSGGMPVNVVRRTRR